MFDLILIASISFWVGVVVGVVVAVNIAYGKAEKRIAYEKARIENDISDYFREVVYNSPSSKIPFDVVGYNKDIRDIIRKGGLE